MDNEQIIRIALTVVTPILTAGIGIVALVIGDWRERRTRHGLRKISFEDASRQVEFAADWFKASKEIAPAEEAQAAARAQAWLEEASDLVAETKPPPRRRRGAADHHGPPVAFGLPDGTPQRASPARFLLFLPRRGGLPGLGGAGCRLRPNGHDRYPQLLLRRVDLRRSARHLHLHRHRDGVPPLVAARGGITIHRPGPEADDGTRSIAVVPAQRDSRPPCADRLLDLAGARRVRRRRDRDQRRHRLAHAALQRRRARGLVRMGCRSALLGGVAQPTRRGGGRPPPRWRRCRKALRRAASRSGSTSTTVASAPWRVGPRACRRAGRTCR